MKITLLLLLIALSHLRPSRAGEVPGDTGSPA